MGRKGVILPPPRKFQDLVLLSNFAPDSYSNLDFDVNVKFRFANVSSLNKVFFKDVSRLSIIFQGHCIFSSKSL